MNKCESYYCIKGDKYYINVGRINEFLSTLGYVLCIKSRNMLLS